MQTSGHTQPARCPPSPLAPLCAEAAGEPHQATVEEAPAAGRALPQALKVKIPRTYVLHDYRVGAPN